MVSEEDCVRWSKGKKGKKSTSKGKTEFSEGDSRTRHQENDSDKEYQSCKRKGKDQRENEKKVSILNQDFQLQKHQVKKDMAIPGNLMSGIQASLIPLVQHFRQREILHGWRQFL